MGRVMFARFLPLALLSAACAPAGDAPRLPTAAEARAQGAALVAACDGREGWSDPAPPARIHGTTYYVGTCGITVLLVTTPDGHALIDGATAEAAPQILANIRALGFDPRDVKVIVGSHEHHDHMGGFAALKAATGARLLVSEAARHSVETGAVDPADPQTGVIEGMIPVAVDGIVRDGEPVPVGAHGFMLYPVATRGHTAGGTSWTWQSCENGECISLAYVDSLTAVSREGYRFTDHFERVAPFRTTFDRVHAMPCDILVTPHPSVSNLFARLSGAAQLQDSAACEQLAAAMRLRLDARLAQEAAQ
jgi:metallo-beta-lactamase class B